MIEARGLTKRYGDRAAVMKAAPGYLPAGAPRTRLVREPQSQNQASLAATEAALRSSRPSAPAQTGW